MSSVREYKRKIVVQKPTFLGPIICMLCVTPKFGSGFNPHYCAFERRGESKPGSAAYLITLKKEIFKDRQSEGCTVAYLNNLRNHLPKVCMHSKDLLQQLAAQHPHPQLPLKTSLACIQFFADLELEKHWSERAHSVIENED